MTIGPCVPVLPTLGVVSFSFAEFETAYPEFTGLGAAVCARAFGLATLQLAAGCGSVIVDAVARQALLYLLTAHVTYLANGTNDGAGNVTPAPGIVGRIADAAEGAVSVAADYGTVNQSEAYYVQTKYGAQYWQATSQFRTMAYIPGQHHGPGPFGPVLGPFGPDFGGGGGC